MNYWRFAFTASALVLLGTGCETFEKYSLTHKLWTTDDFSKYSEPVPIPKLALFDARDHQDVLARYDAYSDSHSSVQRRAYLLKLNRARVPAAKPPLFVDPALADGLQPIPVLGSGSGSADTERPASVYARTTRDDQREFILFRPNAEPETFELPVYLEGSGGFSRVALTPLAVAGDGLMVGGVAAVVGFVGWLQVGAPGIPCPHP